MWASCGDAINMLRLFVLVFASTHILYSHLGEVPYKVELQPQTVRARARLPASRRLRKPLFEMKSKWARHLSPTD